jgi:hypothetical protein
LVTSFDVKSQGLNAAGSSMFWALSVGNPDRNFTFLLTS